MTARHEMFHEMRQEAEKALLRYVKEKKIQISAVRSISWMPESKVHREGVEANMYDHGKKWLLEASFEWENGPGDTITFDRNNVRILEL